MTVEASETSVADAPPKHRSLLRNTLWLALAQIVGTPLSLAVNAAMARYLGAEDFGYIYLAGTYVAFGFLVVEWGQPLSVPAMIARQSNRSGELVGSAVAWSLTASVVVYAFLAAMSGLLGYTRDFHTALILAALTAAIGMCVTVCQAAIRGFERNDLVAFSSIGQQLLIAGLVIPTLLAGGRLRGTMLAQATAGSILLVFVVRAARKAGVNAPRASVATVRELLTHGYPFLFMNLAIALQPSVDAVFVARFASHESVGWYAAARKLVGVLIFPVAALVTALYPTLCRLYATDDVAFRKTTSNALRSAAILGVPVAAGCALFPGIGVSVFSKASFGPAEDDLRLLAPFLFLVYFTMVLGTAIAAIGKQRPWAIAQCLCILVSAVLDPFLVPWFQTRMGNGGLGVCVATLASEVLMLIAGLWLLPSGIFNRATGRVLGIAILSGGGMALVAKLLSGAPSILAAAVSVLAYGGCLWVLGGVEPEQVQVLKGFIDRKRRK